MRGVLQDVRFGARMLARSPGFTAVAVLVLALGIGVNTAVFTLVNAMLLQPLNGGRTGALTGVFDRDVQKPDSYRGLSYPDYVDLRDRSGVFERLAAIDFTMTAISEQPGTTRRSFAGLVSSNYFDTLGAQISHGRSFSAEEERPGGLARVAIASYEYWRRSGFDTAIIGRTLTIAGQPFTIVGVTPEGFTGTMALFSPELWLPLGAYDLVAMPEEATNATTRLGDRATHRLMLAGRLAGGVTTAAASERLALLAGQMAKSYPAENRNHTFVLHGLSRPGVGTSPSDDSEVSVVTTLLMAMAGVVLLVACLNLANMLLARGTGRRREIAIRIAIGGGRGRIVRQLLTEGLLLAAAGGAAGLVLAFWATRTLMLTLVPVMPLPVSFDATPDLRILGVTLLFAVASTLLASAGPAWSLTRPDVLPDLKEQPPGLAARRGWRALASPRELMVAGQLALSLMLLTAGGLFLRGALAAAASDPGFSLERGLVVTVDTAAAGYDEPRGRAVYQAALDRVRSLPGVEAASFASIVPFGDITEGREVETPGSRRPPTWANLTVVGADYFASLGLPVLRGRGFSPSEETNAQAPRVALVDEALARQLWPDSEPIGQQVRFAGRDAAGRPEDACEVIGIVPGIRHQLFDRTPRPHVYLPTGAQYRTPLTLHVRVASPGSDAEHAMLGTIRRELQAADRQLPVLAARTLTEHRDASISLWLVRAGAALFTTFGALALVLAATGLYGVRAYLVSRRTREIGIRMAVGAQARDLIRLIVGEGLRVTLVGLVVGAALSVGVAMGVASLVYRVSPLDPITFTVAPLVLFAAALVASWLPARRATRVAPVTALRTE